MEAVHIKGILFTGLGFLIGGILGSFVKVLADRSLKKSSFRGRSYCRFCKTKLRWYDLFPVFSYIFLKGACRYCHKKIGFEYLLIEVVMGILVGLLFLLSSSDLIGGSINNWIPAFAGMTILWVLDLIFKVFFITILAALFITDLKKMLIPDRIILPSIGISIIFITVLTIIKVIYLYYYLSQTRIGQLLLPPHSDYFYRHALMAAQPFFGGILSGLAIGGFFYLLIIITKGKGMGGGDVKLGAFMGLVLGFPNSLIALILSFFTGAFFSVFLLLLGKKKLGQVIPFGPFLVLGSLIALFWGKEILNWYLNLSI